MSLGVLCLSRTLCIAVVSVEHDQLGFCSVNVRIILKLHFFNFSFFHLEKYFMLFYVILCYFFILFYFIWFVFAWLVWVCWVFLLYFFWGGVVCSCFLRPAGHCECCKKTRVGEVLAASHGFVAFYLDVYQSLKVPLQITLNIHGLGLFICTSNSISSLSNATSRGTFKSTGMLYPHVFVF